MKPGVHCLGLSLAHFGRNAPSSESWRARRNFAFLSGKKPTILPISRRPNFTKFEHNMLIAVVMNHVGTEF